MSRRAVPPAALPVRLAGALACLILGSCVDGSVYDYDFPEDSEFREQPDVIAVEDVSEAGPCAKP